jgi:glycosyltransferase involved in cell wall biosynthesis
LAIIGDGQLLPDIKKKLKLEEKIIIELNVSQNKLIEYYKKSKLILLPSFIESLGLIVLESIYFKKYIIISDNVPFNLNNTTLGETLKLDETIWAQRISSYILNNNHNIDLNKREEILDNYSLANIVSLWRNNLSKLLNI